MQNETAKLGPESQRMLTIGHIRADLCYELTMYYIICNVSVEVESGENYKIILKIIKIIKTE